jgi:Ca2+-transporting ATPase
VGYTREKLEHELPRRAELPFAAERRAMTTIHETMAEDSHHLLTDCAFVAITKGAPDRLVNWASREHTPAGPVPLTDERRRKWQAQIDRMASEGLRVLGIAYRPLEALPAEITPEIERDLTLIGLIGIVDPARPEAQQAIRVARQAGIRSIMITGDHALTAEAIARDLGIIEGQKAVTGAELETMTDSEIGHAVRQTSVFARVAPEHKMRLVKALQAQNQVVAMTGDGVNDAPALKQADIGVAMGITGTEVSKGAADMVLTDDNYASIVAAVEEGRLVYDNIRKFVLFLLSSNVGEILVMLVGILIGLPVPLLAIQILWVNLLTDGLPAIALGFEPPEPDLMRRKPRPPGESIFARGVGTRIVWRSTLLAIITLIGFVSGHALFGLDPLSPTLGAETLTRNELQNLVTVDIPEEWDALSLDARIQFIEGESQAAADAQASEGEHTDASPVIADLERVPRTIAFTVLALGQIAHVIAIHAGERELLIRVGFRKNMLMLYAVAGTLLLQLAVIYLPFLQRIFDTYPLGARELLMSLGLATIMFVVVELAKVFRQDESALPKLA